MLRLTRRRDLQDLGCSSCKGFLPEDGHDFVLSCANCENSFRFTGCTCHICCGSDRGAAPARFRLYHVAAGEELLIDKPKCHHRKVVLPSVASLGECGCCDHCRTFVVDAKDSAGHDFTVHCGFCDHIYVWNGCTCEECAGFDVGRGHRDYEGTRLVHYFVH